MRYNIGELSVGQILDQSFSLFKNHLKLFFGIVAILYLPLATIQAVVPFILTSGVEPATPEAAMEALAVTMPITSFLFMLLILIVQPITNAAMTFAVGNEYLDKSTTVKESIGKAFSMIWPVLKTGILSGLFIMIGFICLIIPGIYLSFKYYLAQQVVVLEGESGFAAMKRSGALMKGNMGTAFVLGIILVAISIGVQLIGAIIPIPIVQVLIQIIVSTVLFGIWTIAAVVFYFHCRSKNESYDLTLLAQSVGVEEPQAPPPLPAS